MYTTRPDYAAGQEDPDTLKKVAEEPERWERLLSLAHEVAEFSDKYQGDAAKVCSLIMGPAANLPCDDTKKDPEPGCHMEALERALYRTLGNLHEIHRHIERLGS